MKTLKISVVATLASILLWRVRVPHKMWPAHPRLAYFLLAIILCVALQLTWSDPDEVEKVSVEQRRGPENAESKTDVSNSH
jgi:hypothetical protein